MTRTYPYYTKSPNRQNRAPLPEIPRFRHFSQPPRAYSTINSTPKSDSPPPISPAGTPKPNSPPPCRLRVLPPVSAKLHIILHKLRGYARKQRKSGNLARNYRLKNCEKSRRKVFRRGEQNRLTRSPEPRTPPPPRRPSAPRPPRVRSGSPRPSRQRDPPRRPPRPPRP